MTTSNSKKYKLIRITTIPLSLKYLLKGQLRFMELNGFEVIGISTESEELHEVKIEEGIRVLPVEMTRKISIIKDLIAVWKLYRIFLHERPLIVHTHTPKAGIVGMLAAKFAKIPIRLHTVAGLPLLETSGIKRKVLILVEKLTYYLATYIYPNSNGLKEIILSNNFTDSKKLKVLANGSSNGINTDWFSPNIYSQEMRIKLRIKLGIRQDDFVFIFVGRLVGDKGINELVSAFNILCGKVKTPKIKLLLIGNNEIDLDPLSIKTEETISLNKNIICTGFIKDVREYLAVSNVLVFPSYREGFPNAVLQASSMELACIVTDINGCNEIIMNNKSGKIIPVKDEQKLLECLMWFFENQEESKLMGKKGREIIINKFNQKFVWNCILNEYKEQIAMLSQKPE